MTIIKSKNIILYEIIGILLLFTIFYFIIVNKVSYAFTNDPNALYDSKINLINKMAVLYGEDNLDLFDEQETVYITVSDLVETGYLIADDDHGNVSDPTSEVKKLNELKIRIAYENGEVSTKILS
ncbi:MAG: hypothetical protein E7164_04455 [Firmicutes bacterium]|nr:hypothetical protein [Bacillota bacterium]